VWTELDRLLADRVDTFSVRRIQIYSAGALGLLVAILVGVVVWLRRRPERLDSEPDTGAFASTGRHSSPLGGSDVHAGQPYPAYPGQGTDPAVAAVVGSPRAPAGAR
jgi:hypothetical protein